MPFEDEGLSQSNPELLSSGETVPVDWARLAHYLHAQGFAFDPGQSIRQFAGGFANRNYMIIVDGRAVVLRRPPDGELPPGAHDMSREHRILSRLTGALSFVPKSLHLCESRGGGIVLFASKHGVVQPVSKILGEVPFHPCPRPKQRVGSSRWLAPAMLPVGRRCCNCASDYARRCLQCR